MRVFSQISFTFLLVFFVLASCTKSDNQSRPSTNDLKVKLYIKINNLHPSGRDTMERSEFIYDNAGRLIKNKRIGYDTVSGVNTGYIVETFQYSGTNIIPDSMTSVSESFTIGSTYIITTKFGFNNAGEMIYAREKQMSSTSPSRFDSTTIYFTYSGSTTTSIKKDYSAGSVYDSTTLTNTHTTNIVSGNILSATFDHSYQYNSGTPSNYQYSYSATYDGGKNPYYKLVEESYKWIFIYQDNEYPFQKSVNNAVTMTGSGYSEVFSKTFTYNSDNYPVESSFTEREGRNINRAGKEYFYYY